MEAALDRRSQSESRSSDNTMFGAVVTGQIAGLIMAVVVMLVFVVFYGRSPLYPVQVIGSMVFGEAALPNFHFGALLAGLVLHQVGPSLLWGVVFGLLAKQFSVQTTKESFILGIGIGIIAMVGPYLLIPFLMNALHGVDIWNREVPIFWDWAAHIVFGASFALYPAVARKINSK